MANIDAFKNCCLFREFLDAYTLLIITYHNETKKFYQKIITSEEWLSVTTNFTLSELEMIFKVCIQEHKGYTLDVSTINNETIMLSFTCREMIKTYKWSIVLYEKNMEELKQIEQIFTMVKDMPFIKNMVEILEQQNMDKSDNISSNKFDENNNIQIRSTNMGIDITKILEMLEGKIKELFSRQKKELCLVPFIAQLEKEPPKKLSTILKKQVNDLESVDECDDNDEVLLSSEEKIYKKLCCQRKQNNFLPRIII